MQYCETLKIERRSTVSKMNVIYLDTSEINLEMLASGLKKIPYSVWNLIIWPSKYFTLEDCSLFTETKEK